MSKKLVRLSENELHKVIKESVKIVLNEISSDVLDNASEKAMEQGRLQQMGKLKNGAMERRKKELTNDNILSCYFNAKRDYIDIADNNRRLTVNSNGIIESPENYVQYGNPNMYIVSWPLDYKYKLSSKHAKQLAYILVKWCDKYLTQEGKEKLQGFKDWHNWVQL